MRSILGIAIATLTAVTSSPLLAHETEKACPAALTTIMAMEKEVLRLWEDGERVIALQLRASAIQLLITAETQPDCYILTSFSHLDEAE